MVIKKLPDILKVLKEKPKKRLVAAYANDAHTIGAVDDAVSKGIVEGILVGDKDVILETCRRDNISTGKFNIIHEPDESKAAAMAVAIINRGEGDILMKGLVSTDKYLKAILNKEEGLVDPGAILTHITVMEVPSYHKLLVVGDVAIIPQPELKEKIIILNHLVRTARKLGVEKPKVAVIAATEQVLPKMQACVDAAILVKMADRGQIRDAIVDGPVGLDVAVDKKSAEIKKITSPVGGDADCLLFPNIESGNVFYKFNTKLAGGELGAIVVGARVPAVLSSRGDSVLTKLYSIALGALMST